MVKVRSTYAGLHTREEGAGRVRPTRTSICGVPVASSAAAQCHSVSASWSTAASALLRPGKALGGKSRAATRRQHVVPRLAGFARGHAAGLAARWPCTVDPGKAWPPAAGKRGASALPLRLGLPAWMPAGKGGMASNGIERPGVV